MEIIRKFINVSKINRQRIGAFETETKHDAEKFQMQLSAASATSGALSLAGIATSIGGSAAAVAVGGPVGVITIGTALLGSVFQSFKVIFYFKNNLEVNILIVIINIMCRDFVLTW